MIQPRQAEHSPRIPNPRSARGATHRRIDKKSRARYANLMRVSGVLSVVLSFLMGYVVLTSNLTGLAYAISSAQHQRAELQGETMRLDDRIAALRSDDRLAALAAKLGMHEPQHFALVQLPKPQSNDRERLASFPSIAGVVMPAP